MTQYKTIENAVSFELVEKKSRFIGYVMPVKTQHEAEDFIDSIRRKHNDARHNVFAYILRDGGKKKYSDDGEPQGTAGLPILEVLSKLQVVDCVVVVTRYFGGILLGAGGLVRAYSATASKAVEQAGIVSMTLCSVGSVFCEYSNYQSLINLLEKADAKVEETIFLENVEVRFFVEDSLFEGLTAKIFDKFSGKFQPSLIGKKFLLLK